MSCACCGKGITGNFINVHGGALLFDPNDKNSSSMSDEIDEFLSISTHEDSSDTYVSVMLAEHNKNSNGQFEWYFCDKKCVRQFFNDWLDKIPDIGEMNGN